jgi:uncharacterized membrane protein
MVSHERVAPENGFLRAALGGLAVAGLLVSAYLTWAHLAGAEPVCGFGGGGCRAVQASPYAAVLGIPVPMLGLAGYAGLLLAAVLRGEAGAYLGLLVALVGALFSAYLTYLEIFVIGAICQWCVASAAIMFGALVCASLRMASLPKGR